jgi:hypothetical protein
MKTRSQTRKQKCLNYGGVCPFTQEYVEDMSLDDLVMLSDENCYSKEGWQSYLLQKHNNDNQDQLQFPATRIPLEDIDIEILQSHDLFPHGYGQARQPGNTMIHEVNVWEENSHMNWTVEDAYNMIEFGHYQQRLDMNSVKKALNDAFEYYSDYTQELIDLVLTPDQSLGPTFGSDHDEVEEFVINNYQHHCSFMDTVNTSN